MATSLEIAQDAVWCDLCPSNQFLKSPAELHCKPCNTNLCQGCAGKHLLSKTSIKHDTVEYKFKETEPNYPECQTHRSRKCELQCQECQLPVCITCLADSHKGHIVAELNSVLIDSKIVQITEDNEELEKIIVPEYEKHYSEIRNTMSIIYQTIEKNKKILKSKNITELANYRSRNDEFKTIPASAKFSLFSFKTIKTQGKEQYGSLKASIKSEIKGYTIKMTDRMSSALSIKQLLDQSQIITTTDSGIESLIGISCVGSDEVWISGYENRTIKHIDIRGTLLQKFTDVCSSAHPFGLNVSRSGAVLYCDYDDSSVKMILDKKIHTLITLQDWWAPLAVCALSSGDILVLMKKGCYVKLVRYSACVMRQEIQYDDHGEQLFDSKYLIRYVEENKNQDICVQNNDHIVVMNQSGQLRFRYYGLQSANKYTTFMPQGIATDSKCQILVADEVNDCVHVINKDGEFLCYIDNCGLLVPWPVSVDSHDRLWVGSKCYPHAIKVIQYMK